MGPSGVKRISGTHEGVTGDFRAIFKFAVPKPAAYVLRLMHRIAPAEMDTTPETLEKRLVDIAMQFSLGGRWALSSRMMAACASTRRAKPHNF